MIFFFSFHALLHASHFTYKHVHTLKHKRAQFFVCAPRVNDFKWIMLLNLFSVCVCGSAFYFLFLYICMRPIVKKRWQQEQLIFCYFIFIFFPHASIYLFIRESEKIQAKGDFFFLFLFLLQFICMIFYSNANQKHRKVYVNYHIS
jgi:hypothetical protein